LVIHRRRAAFSIDLSASDHVTEYAIADSKGRSIVRSHSGTTPEDDGPSAEDLNAIERESDLIAAEMALLDAEIRILAAEHGPSSVDWQRLRRAVRQMLREAAAFYTDRSREPEGADDYPDHPEGDAA
jgi:hypothetical protein